MRKKRYIKKGQKKKRFVKIQEEKIALIVTYLRISEQQIEEAPDLINFMIRRVRKQLQEM
jgi:hypothetical protein